VGRGKSTAPGLILEEHSGNGNSISGMPRQCPTQRDQRPARPAWPRLARRGVLACAFAALMAGGPALAGAGPASAATAAVTDPAGARPAAGSQRVTVGITSVNPQVATPGRPVTVQGTVSNPTRGAVSGLTVQLRSSGTALTSRTALSQYAAGKLAADVALLRAVARLPGTLAPGAVRDWTATIRPGVLPLTTFGVYPLAAELDSGGTALSTDHTFLPFWPGSRAAAGLTQRMKVAWIWPIFSAPEQAACPALLNNGLASSLTAGGRLGRLLAAGSTPAAVRADLTWAIDPSVLSSAAAMRQAYQVGGNATCSGAVTKRGSPAARSWLAGLRSVTAEQDYFVTPYADVDVSALTHAGLVTDLQRAQKTGAVVAGKFLGGPQRPAVAGGGTIAWPAAGVADFGVLGNLAATGVSSVILNSSLMPPKTAPLYTPSAITSALDGVNAGVHVALTDNILGQVLADGPTAAQARRAQARTQSATGRSAGGQSAGTVQAAATAASFATEQRFLAETAMIAAEFPAIPRSVVIAPPRQWNPTDSLATALLADSDDAPWLRPASVSTLIAANSAAGQVPRAQPPGTKFGRGELHRSLLRKVRGLEDSIRLQASMFGVQPPAAYLAGAVAAVESSAWRGHPHQAKALLASVSAYLAAQERQVRIIDTGQDTLTGKSGPVPVSINNRLGKSVTVVLRVRAPAGRMTVHPPFTTVTIGPHQQRTVVIKVRSAVAGSTVLRLSLAAPNGAPLPGTQATLTVDATHFGTTALVIVAIAIAVFVVTAITRAIRRGGASGALLSPRRSPGPGQDANGADPTGSPGEPDTVVSEPARDHQTPEEPDEYASAPGRVDRP
jgi:hypothetical protein